MRIKSLSELRGGEILGEPVRSKENEILIPKGTKLKKEYISIISSLEIDSISVEDPYEKYERINRMLCPDIFNLLVVKIQKLMERHIYHEGQSLHQFEVIANEIVKEINKSENKVIDMDERNPNLYEHTLMVTLLSVSIAKKMNMDTREQYEIAIGCLLHDIGLRYITVEYMNKDCEKADSMDVFEFKKHTILGYSALDEENWIPDISRKMILCHHEKQDKSGFPMRRKNNENACKIIQVCDTFDGLVSGMECKRTSVQNAIKKLKQEAGVKYDEKIVDILLSMVAQYPVGTTVRTENKTEGVVISQTADPDMPIILIPSLKNKKYNLMLEKNVSILQIV